MVNKNDRCLQPLSMGEQRKIRQAKEIGYCRKLPFFLPNSGCMIIENGVFQHNTASSIEDMWRNVLDQINGLTTSKYYSHRSQMGVGTKLTNRLGLGAQSCHLLKYNPHWLELSEKIMLLHLELNNKYTLPAISSLYFSNPHLKPSILLAIMLIISLA